MLNYGILNYHFKMTYKNYFILFLLIVCTIFSVNAQNQSWTLEQCIEYAKKNNLQIKQEQYNLQLSEINLKKNRTLVLPALNGNASCDNNFGKNVDQITNEFTADNVISNNFYASTNINLFKGFQLLNSIRRSQIEYEASQYNLKAIENEISINIATAFLQILYNNEILKKLEQQNEITVKEIERTKKLFELGAVSSVVLLNLEAQLTVEEHQILISRTELEMSYLLLSQILDLPSHKNFEILIPDINIEDSINIPNIESIYEYALKNQPEVKSSELQIEIAKKSYLMSKGVYYPSLSLGISSGTGYSEASKKIINIVESNPIYEVIPYKDQINRNFYYSVGVNLTIPIFNSMQNKYNIDKSKINIYQAENLLQQKTTALIKTINQLYFDALSSIKKFQSAQKQLTYLMSAFNVAEERFTLQDISFIEYQDAKIKVSTANSELLQAKYEFIFKIKLLDFYLGKEIKL